MNRGIVDWARRLAAGGRYDPAAEINLRIAQVVDAIYGR
jgi:hypothetical protein